MMISKNNVGKGRLSTVFFGLMLLVFVASISSVVEGKESTSSTTSSFVKPPKSILASSDGSSKNDIAFLHQKNGNNNKKATTLSSAVSTTTTTRGGASSSSGGGNGSVTDSQQQLHPLFGPITFIILNEIFTGIFKKLNIDFPAPLGGCMIMFILMTLGEIVFTGFGDTIFDTLGSTGSTTLAKWLPVFFAPAMVAFPLSPSVGGPKEFGKVLLTTAVGVCFTLYSTSYFVLGLNKIIGKGKGKGVVAAAKPPPKNNNKKAAAAAAAAPKKKKAATTKKKETPPKKKGDATPATPPPPKAFSDDFMDMLLKASVTLGIISIASQKFGLLPDDFPVKPIETLFLTISTIASFVYGSRLPAGFRAVIHPTLVCTALASVIVYLNGQIIGTSYIDSLKSFKTGISINNKKDFMMNAGAGDMLFYMLGPAVVSFSQSMYSRRKLLVDNLFVVVSGILFGSFGSLFGTAAFVNLINLGGNVDGATLRLSVLSRSVTAPLAVVVSDMIGGNMGITAAVVVMTGISVASFGQSLLDFAGIKDPVARGIGQGAAGQSLGTAAISSEQEAFPFAAMTFVFMAVLTTIITTIPFFKDALINVATSGMSLATETVAEAAESVAEVAAEAVLS